MTPACIRPREPIAIVRLDDLSEARSLSSALRDGGIIALEFTLTNRNALAATEEVRSHLPDVVVGVGTVLDAESARAAILSGAQFLVTPTLELDVIACARRYGVPVMCGAFSPTEILRARQAGADLVKVFPAGPLGPGYIKDVLGPLPYIPMVPTGGVNLENCAAFLAAGAYTVAVGSGLVAPALVGRKNWPELTNRARAYVEACRAG